MSKGAVFVVLTTSILYVLLRREIRLRANLENEHNLTDEQFRFIIAQLPLTLWTVDQRLHIQQILGNLPALFPSSPNVYLGQNITDIMGQDSVIPYQQALAGYNSHYEMVSGEQTFEIYVTPYRNQASEISGSISVALDITEQKRAEQTNRQLVEQQLAEQVRQQSEQLYRGMFEQNWAVMMLLEPTTGQIIDANPAAATYYGYSLDALKTMAISQINTLSPEAIREGLEKARTRKSNFFQFRHRLSSGEIRDVEVYSTPVELRERRFLFSIIVDVTERRHIEAELKHYREHLEEMIAIRTIELKREIAEREQAEQIVRRVNRAFQVLGECNQALVRASDEAALLKAICNVVVTTGCYQLAWVGLAEQDEKKTVRAVASAGYNDGYLENIHVTWADEPHGRGPTGTAIRTGQPQIARPRTDPHYQIWRDLVNKQGHRASIALPIFCNTEIYGALNVYSTDAEAFNHDEAKLLLELAQDVGYGITSLRAHAAHQQAEATLRQSEERLRAVIQNMPVIMNAFDEQGNIIVWNREGERITGYAAEEVVNNTHISEQFYPDANYRDAMLTEWWQRGNNYRDWEWRVTCKDGSTKTISWSNISGQFPIPGWTAWGIGIDVTERVKAQEELRHALRRQEDRVAERTNQLMQANEQLQKEIREREHAEAAEREQRIFAESLHEMVRIMNSSLDLEEVLDCTLSNLGRFMPHDALCLMLAEKGNQWSVRVQCHPNTPELSINQANRKQILADEAQHSSISAQTEPVLVTETRSESRFINYPYHEWIRSYVSAPIWVNGEIAGYIRAASATAGIYQTYHLERLRDFTEQAAIAIRNAQLFAQASELAALEERQRLARDLHDAVSQTIFSATLVAEALLQLWHDKPEKVPEGLTQLHRLTRGALAEMHTLLLELRPQSLAETPLANLLNQLTEAFIGRTGTQTALYIEGDSEIPANVKEILYRIAQEALNNIDKHARAHQVAIRLIMAPPVVELWVQDDGCGFDTTQTISGEHLGLQIMRERAAIIGAQFQLTSAVHQGTVIHIRWLNS